MRVVGVLLAASTFVLLVVLGHAFWPQAAETLDVVAGALLAAQLTATVLGRRPRTVAVVVRQTFVYTVLLAMVAGLAVLVATVLRLRGHNLPDFGIAVIAAGAALAVHPLRVRLAALVDRLLYGDLRDPYRALQRLAEQTHTAPSVDAVLSGLAATVAASLRVPWSRVEAGGHAEQLGGPVAGEETRTRRPRVGGRRRIGTITVAPGPAGSGARSCGLLADLGRHGGVAVQAALLTDALRAGRQRLVVAREEERRRLRRDLHDGVGPTLAGLTMQLGAVRPLVRSDPDAVADRLGRLQDAARGALDTVRRMAHGLRPPALDELGLVGALRQLAESLGPAGAVPRRRPAAAARRRGGRRLPDRRRGAAQRRPARRHRAGRGVAAGRRRRTWSSRVRDSGAGVDGTRPAGDRPLTMRERADELGGAVTVDSAPGRGTTVTARLPLRESARRGAHVSEPLRVVLADDHPMFREGLRFTLEREPDLAVVGEAADRDRGRAAGRGARSRRRRHGPGHARAGRAGGDPPARPSAAPAAAVLVLTMSEDDESVFAALRAGAGGYLVKGADPDQVVSAVRAVARGHAVFGPHLAGRMLTFFAEPRGAGTRAAGGLSAREREVLTLLAEGLSNAEIGRALFISPITVRNHVSSIFAKLQVTNRRQAMLRVRATLDPRRP